MIRRDFKDAFDKSKLKAVHYSDNYNKGKNPHGNAQNGQNRRVAASFENIA